MRIAESDYNRLPESLKRLFVEAPNPERDEVLAVFPSAKSSGIFSPVDHGDAMRNAVTSFCGAGTPATMYADSGSAARFFYTAKASASERDDGLYSLPTVSNCDITNRKEGSAGASNPRAGDTSPRKNIHPTVKPIALMRWLVRLVTPPDGIVFDPFGGSGTTCKAARAEGHRSIMCDLEEEHCAIAAGRLSQGVLM